MSYVDIQPGADGSYFFRLVDMSDTVGDPRRPADIGAVLDPETFILCDFRVQKAPEVHKDKKQQKFISSCFVVLGRIHGKILIK
jgi:hypothetical protein